MQSYCKGSAERKLNEFGRHGGSKVTGSDGDRSEQITDRVAAAASRLTPQQEAHIRNNDEKRADEQVVDHTASG